ncbi:YoaK family protein [Methylorubrum rhodesianum]|uniref:YoaK family protein n=1 Tax=Methylorubrum rhodesianum TaxID=29427 RepID=A0ABU9ZBN0_9HYPH|nr:MULTISPECIES: DUF1275 family protein [Methylorubrum]MBY0140939.1 DUF1275 domain-containing protein [Methylorubrum populi]MRI57532.1 DUF1275 domain-containing protein [Methylobacterium sp. DB1607]MBB5763796.1 uncharacterized membrane protein YoaK (UPF0700 family) [Methylorubrum rhodesianum]MBI1691733.1 DUF1275 domain-containing protein [Methylorubrum sp. DB1722]MBK3402978.1 DUF1275 domain-containing protein [Methylorubrum rhodesianum]
MTRPWQIGFGVVLTALAGFVDALGFIRLGGLYTSLMSGNTTQLAVSLGHGELLGAVLPALLIAAFLVGAVSGGAIAALCPPRWVTPAVLGLEAAALSAAVALAAEHAHVGVASLFLALAMGGQNAVLAHVQGFRAGTTFVTGALFAFGQKAALALAGRGPRFGWVGDGSVWLSLLVGAVAGTLAHMHLGIAALAIPACVAAGLCLAASLSTVITRQPPVTLTKI